MNATGIAAVSGTLASICIQIVIKRPLSRSPVLYWWIININNLKNEDVVENTGEYLWKIAIESFILTSLIISFEESLSFHSEFYGQVSVTYNI